MAGIKGEHQAFRQHQKEETPMHRCECMGAADSWSLPPAALYWAANHCLILLSDHSSRIAASGALTSWDISGGQSRPGIAFDLSLRGWLVNASGLGSPAHAAGKEKLAAMNNVQNSERGVFI
jgi:hypothetical protein